MHLVFTGENTKSDIFNSVINEIKKLGFNIIKTDETRPWGGFLVIDEGQSEKFIQQFFPFVSEGDILVNNRLSPKILLVEPGKRLSWQYHFRRAEIWKIIGGEAGVATSETDEENYTTVYKTGDIISLKQGERHRLVGLSSWGIVAEIWQHTNKDNPSDEDDIVRLQDDYGR